MHKLTTPKEPNGAHQNFPSLLSDPSEANATKLAITMAKCVRMQTPWVIYQVCREAMIGVVFAQRILCLFVTKLLPGGVQTSKQNTEF